MNKPNKDEAPAFSLYRDPRTKRVMSRYQILMKWFREKQGLNLNAVRRTLYTMRTDEQTKTLKQAVEYFHLIPFGDSCISRETQLDLNIKL